MDQIFAKELQLIDEGQITMETDFDVPLYGEYVTPIYDDYLGFVENDPISETSLQEINLPCFEPTENEPEDNTYDCSSAEISPKIDGKSKVELSLPEFKITISVPRHVQQQNDAQAKLRNKWTINQIKEILHNQNSKDQKNEKVKRNVFTKKQKEVLDHWFFINEDHPYPTIAVIKSLSTQTNLSPKQIRTYFVNKRIRNWSKKEEDPLRYQAKLPVYKI